MSASRAATAGPASGLGVLRETRDTKLAVHYEAMITIALVTRYATKLSDTTWCASPRASCLRRRIAANRRKSASATEVILDNVVVPAENVLGEVGKGYKIGIDRLVAFARTCGPGEGNQRGPRPSPCPGTRQGRSSGNPRASVRARDGEHPQFLRLGPVSELTESVPSPAVRLTGRASRAGM